MVKFGNIEIMFGSCNVSTVKDGRGSLYSWVPKEPILEFNLVQFSKSKIRGNHYHLEFNEYILIVGGTFSLVTKDSDTGEEIAMIASKGSCFLLNASKTLFIQSGMFNLAFRYNQPKTPAIINGTALVDMKKATPVAAPAFKAAILSADHAAVAETATRAPHGPIA